ncbi:hypothetical protein AURDEDRAFT_174025, partial [Auricularia subglabra TFB-10046 SS5]
MRNTTTSGEFWDWQGDTPTAEWSMTKHKRTAFKIEKTLTSDGSLDAQDWASGAVFPFSVVSPNVNYPAAIYPLILSGTNTETRQTTFGLGYRYTAVVTLAGPNDVLTKTVEVPAGFTAFRPAPVTFVETVTSQEVVVEATSKPSRWIEKCTSDDGRDHINEAADKEVKTIKLRVTLPAGGALIQGSVTDIAVAVEDGIEDPSGTTVRTVFGSLERTIVPSTAVPNELKPCDGDEIWRSSGTQFDEIHALMWEPEARACARYSSPISQPMQVHVPANFPRTTPVDTDAPFRIEAVLGISVTELYGAPHVDYLAERYASYSSGEQHKAPASEHGWEFSECDRSHYRQRHFTARIPVSVVGAGQPRGDGPVHYLDNGGRVPVPRLASGHLGSSAGVSFEKADPVSLRDTKSIPAPRLSRDVFGRFGRTESIDAKAGQYHWREKCAAYVFDEPTPIVNYVNRRCRCLHGSKLRLSRLTVAHIPAGLAKLRFIPTRERIHLAPMGCILKRSASTGEKYFIAANFYNNERVLPYWTREMSKVITYTITFDGLAPKSAAYRTSSAKRRARRLLSPEDPPSPAPAPSPQPRASRAPPTGRPPLDDYEHEPEHRWRRSGMRAELEDLLPAPPIPPGAPKPLSPPPSRTPDMPHGSSRIQGPSPLVAYDDEDDPKNGLSPAATPPLLPSDAAQPAAPDDGSTRDYSPTVSPAIGGDEPSALNLEAPAAATAEAHPAPIAPPSAAAYVAAVSPMRPGSVRSIEETWTKGDRTIEDATATGRSERSRRSIQARKIAPIDFSSAGDAETYTQLFGEAAERLNSSTEALDKIIKHASGRAATSGEDAIQTKRQAAQALGMRGRAYNPFDASRPLLSFHTVVIKQEPVDDVFTAASPFYPTYAQRQPSIDRAFPPVARDADTAGQQHPRATPSVIDLSRSDDEDDGPDEAMDVDATGALPADDDEELEYVDGPIRAAPPPPPPQPTAPARQSQTPAWTPAPSMPAPSPALLGHTAAHIAAHIAAHVAAHAQHPPAPPALPAPPAPPTPATQQAHPTPPADTYVGDHTLHPLVAGRTVRFTSCGFYRRLEGMEADTHTKGMSEQQQSDLRNMRNKIVVFCDNLDATDPSTMPPAAATKKLARQYNGLFAGDPNTCVKAMLATSDPDCKTPVRKNTFVIYDLTDRQYAFLMLFIWGVVGAAGVTQLPWAMKASPYWGTIINSEMHGDDIKTDLRTQWSRNVRVSTIMAKNATTPAVAIARRNTFLDTLNLVSTSHMVFEEEVWEHRVSAEAADLTLQQRRELKEIIKSTVVKQRLQPDGVFRATEYLCNTCDRTCHLRGECDAEVPEGWHRTPPPPSLPGARGTGRGRGNA